MGRSNQPKGGGHGGEEDGEGIQMWGASGASVVLWGWERQQQSLKQELMEIN